MCDRARESLFRRNGATELRMKEKLCNLSLSLSLSLIGFGDVITISHVISVTRCPFPGESSGSVHPGDYRRGRVHSVKRQCSGNRPTCLQCHRAAAFSRFIPTARGE
ncbi:hypothetical protein PUN28_013183 [Cardiocondyla obscurior]|uniref:Uncharacterized protein n=1 Tax=Cardiocondyla obscurior TaxID=286306 RepID=A0AAW2F739_9HYME